VSWLGNLYVRLVLALPVRDATAGFKAFRADSLREIGVLTVHSNGCCFQIENTWQAVRHGLRLVEVPITFTDRAHGVAKMSGPIVLEAVVRVLGWRYDEVVPLHPSRWTWGASPSNSRRRVS
jgi:dolichol-phosphate mannosyltransferase